MEIIDIYIYIKNKRRQEQTPDEFHGELPLYFSQILEWIHIEFGLIDKMRTNHLQYLSYHSGDVYQVVFCDSQCQKPSVGQQIFHNHEFYYQVQILHSQLYQLRHDLWNVWPKIKIAIHIYN